MSIMGPIKLQFKQPILHPGPSLELVFRGLGDLLALLCFERNLNPLLDTYGELQRCSNLMPEHRLSNYP